MRVGFFGTPEVGVPALQALHDHPDVDVAVVVTNPDRPRGRSGTPAPPPVKVAATALGIDVWQTRRPVEVVGRLEALRLDACAVVAYGALLPRRVLDVGGAGYVNLHFSVLPRWRGAAPVFHALRAGDAVTGVSTFVLDEGMDTGRLLDQVEVTVAADETAGELLDRLAVIGAPVLVDSVRRLIAGDAGTPQPDDGVTYAPKVTPDHARIAWGAPADEVVALVRAANPAPGAHTTLRGGRVLVHRAATAAGEGSAGVVLGTEPRGPVVAAGAGAVVLTEVQPAGRTRVDGAAFARGARLAEGDRFGD